MNRTPGHTADPPADLAVHPSDMAQYALSMLGVYSGAFVRLGFGEFSEVCLVGCRLLRSVLRADFATILLIEEHGHSCAAHSGLPTATARRWEGHPVVDRLIAESGTSRALAASDPVFEGKAEQLGIHDVLLTVPLFDIDTRKGRVAVAVVSGEWAGADLELMMKVLEITSTMLAGAMSNCRLRQRYEQVYLDLDVARRVAEEHSRAKDRFLARMSHELRTPLNIIIGYSDLILEELQDPSFPSDSRVLEQVELVRPIRNSGRHLLSVVNDVLDISKLHSGEVNLHIEDTDFLELARSVAAESHVLARSKNTSISLSGPALTGRTDPRMLRQILYNLLANSCKFTENGRVSIDISSDGSGDAWMVSFEVSDTGIGISEKDLGRIFQEFVQVDESTTRRHGGTGLGLAVSRALSVWLGGDLTVRSQLGVGSTFRLTIRGMLDRFVKQLERQPVAMPTVVLVSSNAGEQVLLTRYLERDGYQAHISAGPDAFDLIERVRPCAVLLDAGLPDGQSGHLLARLRQGARTRAVPVVLLTSTLDSASALSGEVQAVLVRPIPSLRLTEVLFETLGTPLPADTTMIARRKPQNATQG